MQFQDMYPIIVTDKLTECREFYARWLGFEVAFAASWIVLLTATSERPVTLAFMSSAHPSAPPGPERFNGQGMCLEFQVADAAAEHDRLQRAGLPITLGLRDEPWGERRFGLFDPAGTWIDILQRIEPAAGYWDRYLEPSAS